MQRLTDERQIMYFDLPKSSRSDSESVSFSNIYRHKVSLLWLQCNKQLSIIIVIRIMTHYVQVVPKVVFKLMEESKKMLLVTLCGTVHREDGKWDL